MRKSIVFFVTRRMALFVASASMVSVGFAQDGTWTSKAAMPTGRHWLASSVVDGKIYAIGGTFEGEDPYAFTTTEEYNPMTNTWTTKAGMATSRWSLCASVVNGKIYAIGGYNGANLQTVEEYDPATNTWTTKANMPTARIAVCETVNGKIYVLGGGTVSLTGGTVLAVVEEYDPATNTWATKASMPRARIDHASSVVNGQIYVMGGFSPTSTHPSGLADKVDVYNPATNTWATISADLLTLRLNFGARALNGLIYVIGGQSDSGEFLRSVEAYDPAGNRWTTKAFMPTGRVALTTAAVNGRIYAIGGIGGPTTVEEYDPNPTAVAETGTGQPASFTLQQNYPNPFNPTTAISFQLSTASEVALVIYDLNGNVVKELARGKYAGGQHRLVWDGKDDRGNRVASGMYVYKLTAGDFVAQKKLVFMK